MDKSTADDVNPPQQGNQTNQGHSQERQIQEAAEVNPTRIEEQHQQHQSERTPTPSPPVVASPVTTPDNLFVCNLPSGFSDQELEDLFAEHGKVDYAKVMVFPSSLQTVGHGFVLMASAADAQLALTSLNGKEIKGCVLGVAFSERDSSHLRKPQKHVFIRRLPITVHTAELSSICEQFGTVAGITWGQARADEPRNTHAAIVTFVEAGKPAKTCERHFHRQAIVFSGCTEPVTLLAKQGEPPSERLSRQQREEASRAGTGLALNRRPFHPPARGRGGRGSSAGSSQQNSPNFSAQQFEPQQANYLQNSPPAYQQQQPFLAQQQHPMTGMPPTAMISPQFTMVQPQQAPFVPMQPFFHQQQQQQMNPLNHHQQQQHQNSPGFQMIPLNSFPMVAAAPPNSGPPTPLFQGQQVIPSPPVSPPVFVSFDPNTNSPVIHGQQQQQMQQQPTGLIQPPHL